MDLATLTNAPRSLTLAGKEWKVSHLTMREWGAVQAWILDNVPSPVGCIRDEDLAGLSPANQQYILKQAQLDQRNWPPRVGSRAWFDALDNPGKGALSGHAAFLLAILGKHQPDFTEAHAAALADLLTVGEILPLVLAALGVDDTGPKSAAPGATNGTSPTTSAKSSGSSRSKRR